MTDKCSALEALLFAAGDPVPRTRLSLILGITDEELEITADELSEVLNSGGHGICLLKLADKLQLCTRAEHGRDVSMVLEQRKPPVLSQSALETLAIIAYYQPVTNAYINKVRGVDSVYTVGTLMDKGLIEVKGRLEAPGRPSLYTTTDAFLRTMGISDLSELPELPDLTSVEGISQLQEKIDALQENASPVFTEEEISLFSLNNNTNNEKSEDGE